MFNSERLLYMNITKIINILLSLLLMGCLFLGCKKKEIPASTVPIVTEYSDFIRGYTSGIIAANQGMEIHFVDLDKLQSVDANSVISITPSIAGQAAWKNSRTLVFYPNKKWVSGTNYRVTVNLNKIPSLKTDQPDFHFSFDIKKKTFELTRVQLENQNDTDLNTHVLSGEIIFSESIPVENIEKMLHVHKGGTDFKATWQHYSEEFRHRFVVENIKRENKAYPMQIRANGETVGIHFSPSQTVLVPPSGTFQYMSHQVSNGSEQSITINFSDPLKADQELNGLVTFDKNIPIRYVVNKNQLRVYTTARQIGNLVMTIFSPIENIKGQTLVKNQTFNIAFLDEKPQVALLKKGVIIPRSEGLRFSFKAVNVRAVRLKIVHIIEDNIAFFLQENKLDGTNGIKRAARLVHNDILHLKTGDPVDFKNWNNYSFNLEQYIDVEPGAMYRVILSLEREFSLYPCPNDTSASSIVDLQHKWNKNVNESDENYYSNYEPNYYHWNEDDSRLLGNPCHKGYFSPYETTVSQSIIASDIGLIAKMGEGNMLHIIASDIRSTLGKPDVSLKVYTYQHTLIGMGATDHEGIAHIELQGKPYLLVAKNGADVNYLRLDDGSVESVSMFQVEGQKNPESTKGFIYGERGVWRPGDSIYLQFILQDKLKHLPTDHPIIFEWFNPKGQLIQKEVQPYGNKTIHDFQLKTNLQDPTGNWKAVVHVGINQFTKNIKVETVKPNRLKMDIDFGEEIVSVVNGELTGTFNSKWLHGADASNLEADVKLKLGAGATSFKGYEGYSFDDETKLFRQSEKEIFKGKLSDLGEAKIKAQVTADQAPGMLTAQLTSRVYEQGGEFSIDRKIVMLSPYDHYVGVKIPDGSGWRGAMTDTDEKIAKLAMLDANGKPLSGQVEVAIYGLSWRWWYERNNGNSLSNFMRSKENKLIKSDVVEIKNGEAFFDLPNLSYNDSYLLVIKDNKGGHSASHEFRYYWNTGDANNKESSKMLQFQLTKKTYPVGEQIEVNIPSNGKGHFIVTLENANDVIEIKRIKAKDKNTKVSLYADRVLIPNAYVYVAYIQPHAQTANDLPIRMYGVQPVFIEDQTTQLNPTLNLADKWEPEQTVEIEVGESGGKAMEYTLAIVDEGLLQLTRYATPDPWESFHRKEALAVRTWDMYDEVIGAHAGEMAGLLAIGGDGSVLEVGGVKANRFPPMVKFLGPFQLKKGEKRTHRVTLPNYVGQVRIMLVAATSRAYGNAEKSVEVKKPLMVLASLPRVVGPGETVNLPVTTFAMEPNIKNVTVSVETSGLFEIAEPKQQIQFDKIGDQVSYFPIKVANKIGQEKVKIIVEGHGQRAEYTIDIDVRPSNPPVHRSQSVMLDAGETKIVDITLPGIDGTNELVIEAANGLQFELGDKAQQLFRYPHGCIEQTTSRSFPQLFMPEMMELTSEKKSEIDKNVKAGIKRLYSFQLRNGGLGYWPNATIASPWGTTYAGHFMLEARAKGYTLPPGYLKAWVKYQQTVSNNWLPSNYGINDHGQRWDQELIQAYRLYTLALADEPLIGAMNRLRNTDNLSKQATYRLALGYALIGRKEVADQMIANLDTTVDKYINYGETFGSSHRDQAMILETLVKLEKWDVAYKLAEIMAADWKKTNWYSTQTSSYILMSFFKFLDGQKSEDMSFQYQLNTEDATTVSQSNHMYYYELEPPKGDNHKMTITNSGSNRLYVNINSSGVPLEGNDKTDSRNLDMTVSYTDMVGKKINSNQLSRGQDFIVSVTIKNPGLLGNYSEMALTQIFPSGWEIHNTRLDKLADDKKIDVPEYQDIRDDRVYTYFNIKSNETKTFKIKLTATFPGRFYKPAVFCEAMYDRQVYALESGQWVEVVN